jgi:hypothetical protein
VGALVFVQLRFAVFRTLGVRGYTAAVTALLFLLFNTFFAAFFSLFAVRAVVDDHFRPRPAKCERTGSADTQAGTGNYDDSVLKFHVLSGRLFYGLIGHL